MQEPSGTPSLAAEAAEAIGLAPPLPPLPSLGAREVLRHLGLFLAASASMVVTYVHGSGEDFASPISWVHGLEFGGALSLILLSHELGHYIAARIHRVDSSLPFFIPFPILSPFGTMGAVIRMRATIPTRRALLDIGAAGPLAGLAFAIPFYMWGTRHAPVVPLDASMSTMFGDSLLSRLMDAIFAPHIPDGSVQVTTPIFFAAWAGLFVTMLNLLPIGQLDGGHIAYALFGKRQDRAAVFVHRSLLAFFLVSLVGNVARDVVAGVGTYHLGRAVNTSIFWLVWFEALGILGALTKQGRDGPSTDESEALTPGTRAAATLCLIVVAWLGRDHAYPTLWAAWFVGLAVLLVMEFRGGTLGRHTLFEHPPVADTGLGPARTVVAVVSLVLFVLLFMPTPITM